MFYLLSPVSVKRCIIRTINADPEQGNASEQSPIERGLLPACKEQAPVGHDEWVHIAGQVEGQAAYSRAVEFTGIQVGDCRGTVFIQPCFF
ncbi:hypothetical protein ES703_113349 [subsurface metagenome]